MKRGKPLRADPEKVREWQRKSRARQLERKALKRNPTPRSSKLPGARGWTQRVFTLYGRQCVCCGKKAVQGHHAVPKQVILSADHLSQEERESLAYDARNGVPVCKRCHEKHETATKRILLSRLPGPAIEWAVDHGFEWYIRDRNIYRSA